MLSVGVFIDALYQIEEILFYSSFVECFYHEKVLGLSKAFSENTEMIEVIVLYFYGVLQSGFHTLSQSCILG